jgi:hypothetical protein
MAILNDGLFACLPGAALLFPSHEYTVRAREREGGAMAILNDGLFACLPGAALLFPGHEYTVRAGQSVGLDDREASTHYARASPAPASTPATTLETTSTPAPASGVHHCC